MAISREDMNEIKVELDDRYVLQNYCNDRQQKVNDHFAYDDKRIEATASTVNSIKKVAWLIASAVCGEIVISLCNLILK